ncbi:Piso0_000765 [Millerozyma farinosa CBS 7064]|uniref:Piso0_000765 protein n=1 Tax=Pichia sorbitophila (strain ATCC MYA-4447 / BCRC 22081 / CBS 7064 / NBRC 10061 / NRRL Y-12695) TaxID=559304 RepID=G8YRG2_PICSO|nr:Piso0_000765 [Millerozyma farinosa CBS 7064]
MEMECDQNSRKAKATDHKRSHEACSVAGSNLQVIDIVNEDAPSDEPDLEMRNDEMNTQQRDLSELEPLLGSDSVKKTERHAKKRIIFIGASILFIFVCIMCFPRLTAHKSSESLIAEAIDVKIGNVSIVDVDDGGVELDFEGSIAMNYSNIESYSSRTVLRTLGRILRYAHIVPLEQTEVFARVEKDDPESNDIPLLHVFTFLPPKLDLDIRDGAINSFSFHDQVSIEKKNSSKILWQMVKAGIPGAKVLTSFKVVASVETKIVSYRRLDMMINYPFTVNSNKLTPDYEVSDLSIYEEHDGLYVTSEIELHNDDEVTSKIPGVEWNMYLIGCDNRSILLGKWETSPFEVFPHSRSSVEFSGKIETLPEDLKTNCGEASPLQWYLQRILDSKPVPIQIKAAYPQKHTAGFPEWAAYILMENYITLDASELYDVLNRTNKLSNITINFAKITTLVNDTSTLQVLLSADLSFNTSSVFPVKSSTFDAFFEMSFKDIILRANTTSKIHLNEGPSGESYTMSFRDIRIDLLNPITAGKLINDTINGIAIGKNITIYSETSNVEYNLAIGNGEVEFLSLQKQIGIQLEPYNMTGLLEQANVTLKSFLLTTVSENSLRSEIVCEIYNPTILALNVSQVEFDIFYNEAWVGSISSRLDVPKSMGIFHAKFILSFHFHTSEEKEMLQDLMSAFVSGFSVPIKIRGAKEGYLSDLFTHIDVNLDVPPLGDIIVFDEENAVIRNSDVSHQGQQKSAFVLSSTIHILTSELELTVYNPIGNSYVDISIIQAEASHEGVTIGHLKVPQYIHVPPGVYTTPRIPVKLNGGVSMDLLRKYIDGELLLEVHSIFDVAIQELGLQLSYLGFAVQTEIRL